MSRREKDEPVVFPTGYADKVKRIEGRGIWACKIGECDRNGLPDGADAPMRQAVAEAYYKLTGNQPAFLFSGWSAELTQIEEEVLVIHTPLTTCNPAQNTEPAKEWNREKK